MPIPKRLRSRDATGRWPSPRTASPGKSYAGGRAGVPDPLEQDPPHRRHPRKAAKSWPRALRNTKRGEIPDDERATRGRRGNIERAERAPLGRVPRPPARTKGPRGRTI